MGNDRASMFDEEAELDGFAPKPKAAAEGQGTVAQIAPKKEDIRRVAEGAGFGSREPRRHRTGRDVQLNMRVTGSDKERFYEIADQQGWVMGELMHHALDALEDSLKNND